jgi:soluble lytic murein transglycosylase-like protein
MTRKPIEETAMRAFVLCLMLVLAGCGGGRDVTEATRTPNLYHGETPEMRRLVNRYARVHDIPPALLHRVIQRESDYRADARNGPYWGLMQILPQTARTMGHDGPPQELLDPEVNLQYAGRYLRGAWLVSDGDIDEAVGWYARGYYYEARNRCLLVETGLNDREIARQCR